MPATGCSRGHGQGGMAVAAGGAPQVRGGAAKGCGSSLLVSQHTLSSTRSNGMFDMQACVRRARACCRLRRHPACAAVAELAASAEALQVGDLAAADCHTTAQTHSSLTACAADAKQQLAELQAEARASACAARLLLCVHPRMTAHAPARAAAACRPPPLPALLHAGGTERRVCSRDHSPRFTHQRLHRAPGAAQGHAAPAVWHAAAAGAAAGG